LDGVSAVKTLENKGPAMPNNSEIGKKAVTVPKEYLIC